MPEPQKQNKTINPSPKLEPFLSLCLFLCSFVQYVRPLVRAVSGSSGGREGGASIGSAMEKNSSPGDSNYPTTVTPSTDHSLVTSAHKAWNAAVLKAVDKMAGAIYGGGGGDDKTMTGKETGNENDRGDVVADDRKPAASA